MADGVDNGMVGGANAFHQSRASLLDGENILAFFFLTSGVKEGEIEDAYCLSAGFVIARCGENATRRRMTRVL